MYDLFDFFISVLREGPAVRMKFDNLNPYTE